MIPKHIFRQYDIRGIVGTDVNTRTARLIGQGLGTMARRRFPEVKAPVVALGQDVRLSSPDLASAVAEGLASAGCHVNDIGAVPTPTLYHAAKNLHGTGTHAALQVTGSHNPAEYNGFKMLLDGEAIYGTAIQDLYALIEQSDFAVGNGKIHHFADRYKTLYTQDITQRFQLDRPLRVVVDAGNGAAAVLAEDLFSQIDPYLTIIPLFCEPDGRFPNHHPDPVVDKNLAHLIAAVKEHGADFGVAFDGDADRIGAVDEHGNIIRGDILTGIFAQDLLSRHPGHPIVFDVKCSQALSDMIQRAGGTPIVAPTGHSLIKKRMKEAGSMLAGELSGHIMFGENYYGFDDALYAAALLIQIVSRSPRSLGQIVADFPSYVSTPELRYHVSEDEKRTIIDACVQHFSKTQTVDTVDGARVLFAGGWGLLRASNTEPVLVGRMEARNASQLTGIRSTIEHWLETHTGRAIPAQG